MSQSSNNSISGYLLGLFLAELRLRLCSRWFPLRNQALLLTFQMNDHAHLQAAAGECLDRSSDDFVAEIVARAGEGRPIMVVIRTTKSIGRADSTE